MVCLAAEVRSFKRAEVITEQVLGHKVPCSTIRRLVKQVGQELADGKALPAPSDNKKVVKEVVVPEAAVVSCDGGRIRTREPGRGRGVVPSGEKGWRETKNASFERMSLNPRRGAAHGAEQYVLLGGFRPADAARSPAAPVLRFPFTGLPR